MSVRSGGWGVGGFRSAEEMGAGSRQSTVLAEGEEGEEGFGVKNVAKGSGNDWLGGALLVANNLQSMSPI